MKDHTEYYAVIDTNVLVSSLLSRNANSNPAKVIQAVLSGIITPIYNNEIISEYREVLKRKKFNFNHDAIEALLDYFTTWGEVATPIPCNEETFPDNDDKVFYEISLAKDNSYLITGNTRHFPLRPHVVTPAEIVGILNL